MDRSRRLVRDGEHYQLAHALRQRWPSSEGRDVGDPDVRVAALRVCRLRHGHRGTVMQMSSSHKPRRGRSHQESTSTGAISTHGGPGPVLRGQIKSRRSPLGVPPESATPPPKMGKGNWAVTCTDAHGWAIPAPIGQEPRQSRGDHVSWAGCVGAILSRYLSHISPPYSRIHSIRRGRSG